MKKKAYSIALASIFIISLVFVSSATAVPLRDSHNFATLQITSGAGDPSDDKALLVDVNFSTNVADTESIQTAALKIIETRITTNKSNQSDPIIYGNKIVWTDYRKGKGDIYMYDLSTKKETQITTNVSDQYNPDIYGNRVVWVDERNRNPDDISGNSDIYMYDISTKKETQITNNEGYLWGPSIYGDKIVWTACPYGDLSDWYNICIYDISTKKEKMITNNGCSYYPAIYGNKIVWEDYRNGNDDIYMYDISTKKETQITNSGSAYSPAIYGNRIVWTDNRNGNLDIYMYDLSTKKEKRITTNPSYSYYPKIYGDRIVWYDDRNGNWDIYMYDLATGQESHTTDKSGQYVPDIYDDKIVWTDMRNGNADIYMGTISSVPQPKPPVAVFSASPTSGKAPLTVKFIDKSTGSPTSWSWNFGDKSTSTAQNPIHQYLEEGSYTVKLTVTNTAGSGTATKTNYIKVIVNTRPGIYSKNK